MKRGFWEMGYEQDEEFHSFFIGTGCIIVPLAIIIIFIILAVRA